MKEYITQPLATIKSAVNKLVDFIKPTYGPSENKIIIAGEYKHSVLDDGVAIAEEFELPDIFENAVVKLIKEVARKTNDRVGDGTTGSLILLQAIMNEIPDFYTNQEISKELKKGLEAIKKQLLNQTKKIESKEELENVALISYNNPKMAKIISDMIYQVGADGVIAVEEGDELETKTEVVEGMQFERGYVSPYMVTDPERMESILDDTRILITDKAITDIKTLVSTLENILHTSGNKNLLIVADDYSNEVVGFLAVNKIKGNFNAIAVKAPGFGEGRKELLRDIAIVSGTEIISDDAGLKIETYPMDKLGKAKKVVITANSTTIVGGAGKKTDIETRAKQLKTKLEKIKSDFEREKLNERIAKLIGGVGIIKVGANTESEMKSLKYKVEDAVNATKLAYKSGVVTGAGRTFLTIKTDSPILNKALQAPAEVLKQNVGADGLSDKVLDPVEVLIAAVESAVSIALLLIETKGVLVETNDKKN